MGLYHQRDNWSGDDGGSPDNSRGLRGAEPQLATATEAVRPGIRRGDPARTGIERHTAPLPDEPLWPTAQAGIDYPSRVRQGHRDYFLITPLLHQLSADQGSLLTIY